MLQESFDRTAFNLRPAIIADVEEISNIWCECGLSPWPGTDIERELHRSDSIFLKASADGSGGILGFILGRLVPAAGMGMGQDAEIYNIGVRPESRKNGIGSALLKLFIAQCRDAGAGNIWLEVRASNETAIGFYRRHGFTGAGTRKGFYRNPVEDALIMNFALASV